MNNNKGFTLVELLATIAIIGIMSTIAIAGVTTIIKNAHNKFYQNQKNTIVSAAKSYYADHRILLPSEKNSSRKVTYQILKNTKYLTKITDHKKIECNPSSSEIEVTVTRISTDEYKYRLTKFICNGVDRN